MSGIYLNNEKIRVNDHQRTNLRIVQRNKCQSLHSLTENESIIIHFSAHISSFLGAENSYFHPPFPNNSNFHVESLCKSFSWENPTATTIYEVGCLSTSVPELFSHILSWKFSRIFWIFSEEEIVSPRFYFRAIIFRWI